MLKLTQFVLCSNKVKSIQSTCSCGWKFSCCAPAIATSHLCSSTTLHCLSQIPNVVVYRLDVPLTHYRVISGTIFTGQMTKQTLSKQRILNPHTNFLVVWQEFQHLKVTECASSFSQTTILGLVSWPTMHILNSQFWIHWLWTCENNKVNTIIKKHRSYNNFTYATSSKHD